MDKHGIFAENAGKLSGQPRVSAQLSAEQHAIPFDAVTKRSRGADLDAFAAGQAVAQTG